MDHDINNGSWLITIKIHFWYGKPVSMQKHASSASGHMHATITGTLQRSGPSMKAGDSVGGGVAARYKLSYMIRTQCVSKLGSAPVESEDRLAVIGALSNTSTHLKR